MLKDILKLKGTQALSKKMQHSINGGVGGSCPEAGAPCMEGVAVTCIAAEPVCENGQWTFLGGDDLDIIIYDLFLGR